MNSEQLLFLVQTVEHIYNCGYEEGYEKGNNNEL